MYRNTNSSVYPNPVEGDKSFITYNLPRAQKVTIRILDALTGQEKMKLVDNSEQSAGKHIIPFDASSLRSGTYIYQVISDKVSTGRIT